MTHTPLARTKLEGTSPTSYATLRRKVEETLLVGRQRVEQEKIRTYWQTGKVINDYLSRFKSRRDHYGQQVINRLAEDLDISDTLLRRCVRFAQTFKIQAGRPESFPSQLSWTHYRALITVADEHKRRELLNRAVKSEWTAEALEAQAKQANALLRELKNGRPQKSYELLTPRKGTVYTYRMIRPENIHPGTSGLRIDLGFSSYKEASMKGAEALKAGDISESIWVKQDTYRLKKASGKIESDLFTYYAEVERVIDGDTLIAQVDLGFGFSTRQYLRLRGIDAPELDTAEGKRSKRFVESELAGVPYIVIASTRSDKYDRYLADVFYTAKEGEQFLNNRLLEKRFANRI